MKATIKNFMGCAEAEIIADKIALILGLNGQGKSSSLLPISAALRGGMPLGLQKTKAGMLVKTGTGAASIVLENDTSKISVSWPKCERRAEGSNIPEASDIAVGAVKFPAMPDKEKVELLRSILKCEPDEQELCAALAEAGIPEKVQKIVWHNIQTEGWDASLERAKDKGRSLKSQWAIVSGENYGEKKAATWFPLGWENDLEGLSVDTLENDVSLARADLEDKIANQAVGEDELARLKEKVDSLADYQKKCDDAASRVTDANKALKEARTAREKLPALPKYDLICPHCGNPVAYQFGKLEAVKQTLSPEDRENLEQKILDADNAVSKAERELAVAKKDFILFDSSLKASKDAAVELEKKQGKTVQASEVDAARQDVRKAEARLSAFNKYHEAIRIHNNAVENQKIINVLEPEGIRRQALEKGLADFNGRLECLCHLAKWNDVVVEGDMSVNYAGRPFVLCSESEKFRAVVTLQAAIAEYDGSAALVVDAADILDNGGRAGLLKLLAHMSYCSFVGMMTTKTQAVPDLKKLGIGRKYWIEDGKCEEVYNG